MKRLQDKTAIVTGAARGIGKAISMLFAAEGAKVAVTDIIDGEGIQLVEQINANDGQAQYWHLDTSSEEQVRKTYQQIYSTFGGLAIIVNNAGISGANRPTHELTLREWNLVMQVNVTGVFLCTKHAIPYLRLQGGGSIINLSSIYGIISAPDIPPYHASKGAVRMMTKTDALLYARDNIRVNSIHPGLIWTPLVEDMASNTQQRVDEFRKELDKRHPIGHVGEPMDIAYGALYLASDEAKFVTGSELVIDGGYTAR
jgi:NAD(P)-dependent dehydrogenase (short-subunit alcohol dehydrogenase family)